MKPNSKILIVAGSDSSGGAGIQADIKTVTSLGSYAMTAITAVTSQNTTGVISIATIPGKEISKQIEFTSKDIRPDAIKIGMLHSVQVIESVFKSINKIKVSKIILDPVMIAKGGTKLTDKKTIKFLKSKLIKKASLVTPNIPEAEILTGKKIKNVSDMIDAANMILKLGTNNVLIKGGHLNSKIMYDIFLNENEVSIFKNKKINTKNTHGTGCTMSSAIATSLAQNMPLKKAVLRAHKYVYKAIKMSPNIGSGNGPLNHLVKI